MIDSDIYASRLHEMVDGPAAPQTRSIENANTPITAQQLSDVLGYGPTRSGVQINEHTAMTFTAVYAAIRVLAESVGMLPPVVYQGDPDSNDRKRATWHPAYNLLRFEPNADMTITTFLETIQGHLSGWGNGYARILTTNGGQPSQIVPLTPDRVFPERYGGQLRYTVAAGGGVFAPEEILHVKGLGFNGLKGYSPIGLARESIALGKATEIFGATFFGNGASVEGVIEFPGMLKPEQMNTFREGWNAQYSGVGNAHKTAILMGGAKYTPRGIPPEDAQFLETRRFQVIEIARLFRVPPHMLADLERATFANVEQMSTEFLLYTLSPWLTKWEQELTRRLFPAGSDYFVEFDTRRLIRADVAARREFYATGRQWGWFSANDVLKAEGLPSIGKQGDVYLSPVNMTPADQLGKQPPPMPGQPPTGNGPPPPAPPAPAEKPDESKRTADAMTDVFADAVGRMFRKEANAAGRNKADDDFYATHRGHVVEALMPGVRSLAAVMGRSIDDQTILAANDVLLEVASERHQPTELTETAARQKAGEIAARLVATLRSLPCPN